ncbi:MAG TPA: argininosuccinate synthase [bacterium]|nr:argininosuccinate synthase [bacterium]HEX68066.1 argininosuccinate synthase [bacterium]
MKIVLAYSGGLDTSVALKWLQEKYDAEVITYTADIGQGIDLEKIREKALKSGAKEAIVEDVREEFIKDYVFPALKAGALYEGKYPLATALGRPLIAKKIVEIAKKKKAEAVAHGCTGKGNDQVRFELTFMALAPGLKVIAPAREWEFRSREEEIEYAREKGIEVEATRESPYSIDRNLWGVSIECGILEDPEKEPPEDAYQITSPPEKSPSPTYVEIEFRKGIPVAIDSKKLDPVKIVEKLNQIGGKYGIGRIDMVEDRVVGIKSREIYEAPAAVILHTCRDALESLVLDKESRLFRTLISQKYAELTYYGWWFSPLKEALDAFIDKLLENLTGKTRVKLWGGKAEVVSRTSPYSLYKEDLATYSEKDIFDHKASEGFIKLWGLPLKVRGEIQPPQ